ncbi:MAG TPA: hypothetical protein VKG23_11815 [Thermoanaerobaculia bacterium]|nr:hypothetical protein [Thermoanaerobaculia bacterium]
MTLVLSLLAVAAALLVVSAVGVGTSVSFLPPERAFFLERLGWGDALGCAVLIAAVPIALGTGLAPRWGFVVLSAVAVLLGRRLRLTSRRRSALPGSVSIALLGVIALGVAVYALRALTEPMWANDFVAIWGLKGKTIYGAAGYPGRLTSLGFSHPEYPLGLPLLYAGLSFLTGRWDDHAMALLFPFLQAATLLVLFGWLRRRGASPTAAGLATATVAWFEPLYSAFLTGMAEVPLAFGLVLFGTSLADALDDTDAGAIRRLTAAAALIAAIKNEGLFFSVVGAMLALVFGKQRRWKIAIPPLAAALLVRALHWPWRSRIPLADFEGGLFSTSRVWDSLAAAGQLLGASAWIGLALVAVLILAGRSVAAGNRLLLLAGAGVAAYLVIPAFAVRGPSWLIETTLLRTTAALAPLTAAAVAARYAASPSAGPVDPADA